MDSRSGRRSDDDLHKTSRRSGGVVPATTKSTANEHTKLLDPDEAEIHGFLGSKYAGFICLLGAVCTTIAQAEAVQWLQTAVNFQKPFFTMCACHAAPFVFLPLILIYHRFCGTPEDRQGHFDPIGVLRRHSVIPVARLVKLSAYLGLFYLVADYFWFSSFKNLTVSTGQAIFNSAPLFVYCFSICFLHEKASIKKLLGVLTAFGGVTLLVFFQNGDDDGEASNANVVGGLMMVFSAALNAGYNVSVAVTAAEEMNDTSTLMNMMGISGIFVVPAWLVGTVVFANSPYPSIYESVGFPATTEGVLMLVIAVAMYSINFIFLTFAVCWTSPLETSVGYMFTIPLSALMDTILHHTKFSWECIFGSALVMAGFAILELNSKHPPPHQHHLGEREDHADKV